MPANVSTDEILQSTFDTIDPSQAWDAHKTLGRYSVLYVDGRGEMVRPAYLNSYADLEYLSKDKSDEHRILLERRFKIAQAVGTVVGGFEGEMSYSQTIADAHNITTRTSLPSSLIKSAISLERRTTLERDKSYARQVVTLNRWLDEDDAMFTVGYDSRDGEGARVTDLQEFYVDDSRGMIVPGVIVSGKDSKPGVMDPKWMQIGLYIER